MLEPHAEIPCLWIDMAVTIGTSITLSWVYTEVTAVTSGEDVDPRSVVPQCVGAETGLRSSRTSVEEPRKWRFSGICRNSGFFGDTGSRSHDR